MLEQTLGKERDDPELVRFVAQSTGKRSHVSEIVRVRSTPYVANGLSFLFHQEPPKPLQTGYGQIGYVPYSPQA